MLSNQWRLQTVSSIISQGITVVVAAGAPHTETYASQNRAFRTLHSRTHLEFLLCHSQFEVLTWRRSTVTVCLLCAAHWLLRDCRTGNSRISACTVAPADVREAITVAATNLTAKFNKVTNSNDPDSLYKVPPPIGSTSLTSEKFCFKNLHITRLFCR